MAGRWKSWDILSDIGRKKLWRHFAFIKVKNYLSDNFLGLPTSLWIVLDLSRANNVRFFERSDSKFFWWYFFHLKKSPSTKHCWWSLCERAKSGLASSRPAEIPFYTISAILQRVQLKTIAMGFSSILRYIFTSNRRVPCQNTQPHYFSTIPYFAILCTRAEGSLIQNSKSEVEGLFYLAPNHQLYLLFTLNFLQNYNNMSFSCQQSFL